MIVLLFAAIAPFPTWLIEVFLPYPFVIEEIVKAALVFFILNTAGRVAQVRLAILASLIFTFTESVMYITNILLVGTPWTFIERLIFTAALHTITILIILLSGMKKKEFIPLGVIAAIAIHYFFNVLVAGL